MKKIKIEVDLDTDCDIFADDVLSQLIEAMISDRELVIGQTKHRIKITEQKLKNALIEFYQMHI